MMVWIDVEFLSLNSSYYELMLSGMVHLMDSGANWGTWFYLVCLNMSSLRFNMWNKYIFEMGLVLCFGVVWLRAWPSLSLNEEYNYEKHVGCVNLWTKVQYL